MKLSVILKGNLAKFQQDLIMEVSSPAEALRGLCYQVAGFEDAIREGMYRVSLGNLVLADGSQLHLQGDINTTLTVEPVICGAGIVEGVIALFSFLAAPGTAIFGAGTTGALIGNAVGGALVAMAIGGVIQLLSPTPGAGDYGERAEEKPSFLFNGPVNVSEQGVPVPLVYGQCMVGSVVVSSGLSAEDVEL